MPKEQIYGHGLPYGTPEEPGPARSVVEVRWDRETGYFQIATKCIEASTGEDYLPPLEAITIEPRYVESESGEPTTVLEKAGVDVDFFGELVEMQGIRAQSGWYVDLDRKGINELIVVLRRARNAAFGKDE